MKIDAAVILLATQKETESIFFKFCQQKQTPPCMQTMV